MFDLTWMLDELARGLTNPITLFGHFTYFLLIASMLMRRMVWLRTLAVASGLAKIVYRAVFVLDPVSVLWETIFVIVNVVQLLIIWYYEYQHKFSVDEAHFVRNMPSDVERRSIKQLLELADLTAVNEGETLTREGEAVGRLMYVADGIVKIEHDGRIVAICGPGDYVGELSFLSGNPASATATVVKPTRILAFDQARLSVAFAANPQLRRTLESALNRNLAGKLARANNPAAQLDIPAA